MLQHLVFGAKIKHNDVSVNKTKKRYDIFFIHQKIFGKQKVYTI